MVGRSALAAPISKASVVLSQPISSTTPSSGWARMFSSTSMAARLPVEHRGWAHGDLPEGGNGELKREAPRIKHAVADMLGNGAEMGVAGVELRPGVADPNRWASLERVEREATVLGERPV